MDIKSDLIAKIKRALVDGEITFPQQQQLVDEMNALPERIYICAPSYDLFRHYCINRGILKSQARYINEPQKAQGLPYGQVIIIGRDKNGLFDFPLSMRRVLDILYDRAEAGIITISHESIDR